MNNYGAANEFNKMFDESKSKGYQPRYSTVKNNKSNNSQSFGIKFVSTLVVGGVIAYYTYKNILKPAAKFVCKLGFILNDCDIPGSSNDNSRRNNRANFTNDRVFDGQVRKLRPDELRYLERDAENNIYAQYEIK